MRRKTSNGTVPCPASKKTQEKGILSFFAVFAYTFIKIRVAWDKYKGAHKEYGSNIESSCDRDRV